MEHQGKRPMTIVVALKVRDGLVLGALKVLLADEACD